MNTEFNVERTIAGEPTETVSGTPAEFIAYRPTAEAHKQIIMQVGTDIRTYYKNGRYYNNPAVGSAYDLRMKSVVKQVDWSKLPVDTILVVNEHIVRYFKELRDGKLYCFSGGRTSISDSEQAAILTAVWEVQIAQDQPWTIWQGGDCPLPDGLAFEYMIHGDPGQAIVCTESASAYLWQPKLIYAYRLTGKVLDGWKP
jgi:hypothetical protein